MSHKHQLSPASKTDENPWKLPKPGEPVSTATLAALVAKIDGKIDGLGGKIDVGNEKLGKLEMWMVKLQDELKTVQELTGTHTGQLKVLEQRQKVQDTQLQMLQAELRRMQYGDLNRRTSRFSPDYDMRQLRQIMYLEGLEAAPAGPSEALALLYSKLESAGIKLSDGSLMVSKVLPAAAREGRRPRVPMMVSLANASVLDVLFGKGVRDKLKAVGVYYAMDLTKQERDDRRAIATHPNFDRARKALPAGFGPIWRLNACSLEHDERGCYWPEGRPELLWTVARLAHAEVEPMVLE